MTVVPRRELVVGVRLIVKLVVKIERWEQQKFWMVVVVRMLKEKVGLGRR